ncbi:MAG: AAA family ATPase [Chloroflexi bacterium]|jgi:MoxR-like ATPase|nr:AAA family ATPase [Chloroflexota bacterium]
MEFDSIDELQNALQKEQYMADRGLVTAAYLALKLKRPLFLEGEPGVGKTEIAKVLANLLETKLIRLQCYEGLDLNQAAYEWNYTRQMLHIRLLEARGEHARDAELFGREFLLQRPLLEAIEETERARPVLLIDEIDRSDEEFEAFLLEILSDFQITIPEIGTIQAERKPVVILTSNRTREVHDALKRRCIYNWIDYPAFEKEYEIIRAKVPDAPQRLAREVTRFVEELREADLYKIPGVAETIDWTSALVALDQEALSLEIVQDTLGVVLKYQDDIAKINGETARQMLTRVQVSL